MADNEYREIEELFNREFSFKDCRVIEYDTGNVIVETTVNESALNPYGLAHGGFLYTLCDNMAGITAYSNGSYVVTLQSNINYLRSVKENEVIRINGKTVHNGKTTKVINVTITDENEKPFVQASFTMYVIQKSESKKND